MPQYRSRSSPKHRESRRSRSRSRTPRRSRARHSPHRKSPSRSPSPPSKHNRNRLSPKRFRSRSLSPKTRTHNSPRPDSFKQQHARRRVSRSRSRSRSRDRHRDTRISKHPHPSTNRPRGDTGRRRRSSERFTRGSRGHSGIERSESRQRKQSSSPLLVPYSQPSPSPEHTHHTKEIRRKRSSYHTPDREEESLKKNLFELSKMPPGRLSSPAHRHQRDWSPKRFSPPRVDESKQAKQTSRDRPPPRSWSGPIYLDASMMKATKTCLSERHAHGNYRHPFRFEDNITICIRRHGPNLHNSPSMVTVRAFNPDTFIVHRRDDEGSKPIFDREEIKVFRYDDNLNEEIVYEESRVISVTPSEKSGRKIEHGSSHRHHADSDYESQKVGLLRTDRSDDRIVAQTKQTIRFVPRPDPRYEEKFREINRKEESKKIQKLEKIQRNPNDLRHNLMRRHSEETFDARSRIESKHDSRTNDRRQVVRRERDTEERRDHEIARRSPRPRSRIEEPLPDFSRRPDKYRYEEWKARPDMIPTNSSYFEHDNREGITGRGRPIAVAPWRGRGGRGGFHSTRPNYRQSRKPSERYRDGERGGRWSDSEGGHWKHDKFKTLDNDEDQRPTSTTKN